MPDGYSFDCGIGWCHACSPSQGIAICAIAGDGDCKCVPPGSDGSCSDFACITCAPGETALCSSYGYNENACICVPNGYNSTCGEMACIACPPGGGTPFCSGYDTHVCTCVPSGYTAACGYDHCITCPSGSTPSCTDDFDNDYGNYTECTCN